MIVAKMTCDNPPCGNFGEYLSVDKRTLCSSCAMGTISVRISDLPAFIHYVVKLLDYLGQSIDDKKAWAEELRRYFPPDTFLEQDEN